MKVITGDATNPVGEDPKVIVHVCNDIGAWGKGFVLAVSKKWPEPEREYRGLPNYVLGQVQFIEVEPGIWVANLIGQHGIQFRVRKPIRYNAVREGLSKVARFARQHGASVHMPRIGCGLAGGSWDKISQIISEELADVDVTVYVLPKGGAR